MLSTTFVILAGGRNARLKGVIPSSLKPLFPVNGVPLIVDVMMKAKEVRESSQQIIVCSPSNVVHIAELLESHFEADFINTYVTLIVQPRPLGPGDALVLAARHVRTDCVTVLCSDNIIHKNDIEENIKLAEKDGQPYRVAICVARTLVQDSKRFTIISPLCAIVVEREAVPDDKWEDGFVRSWIGPLTLPRQQAIDIISGDRQNTLWEGKELKIGPYISKIAQEADFRIACHVSSCIDIGTIESLKEA